MGETRLLGAREDLSCGRDGEGAIWADQRVCYDFVGVCLGSKMHCIVLGECVH